VILLVELLHPQAVWYLRLRHVIEPLSADHVSRHLMPATTRVFSRLFVSLTSTIQ